MEAKTNNFDLSKHTKDPKKVIITGAILILLVAIILFIFINPQDAGKREIEVINKLMPAFVCTSSDDANSYAIALTTKNINECGCVSDKNKSTICKTIVTDSLLYERARKSFDLSICDEISDPIVVAACRSGVQSGIDFVIKDQGEVQLAYLYFKSANYSESISLLEKKIESDKGNENPGDLILLALNYANMALMENNQVEFTPKALEAIDKAISLSVTDVDKSEAYRVKGFIYEVGPDLNLSIENYDKSVKLNNTNISAYVGRGHALNKLGAIVEAVADFETAKALDTKKEISEIYVQLCRLYATNSDKTQEAIENCLYSIDNFSSILSGDNLSGVHLTLASIYLRAGRVDESINRYSLALTYFPESTDALAGLAHAYSVKEDYISAKEYSKKAIDINPMKAVAYREYAFALFSLGENEEAIEAALKGVDFVDKDASLLIPSKAYMKKQLYYVLSDAYISANDPVNGSKYKSLGDAIE